MAKVLHIITHFDLGGAEVVVKDIVSFVEGEFLVFACIKSNNHSVRSDYQKYYDHIGVKIIENPFGGRLAYVFAPLLLLYIFLKYRPKIIHSHTDIPDFFSSSLILLIGKFTRRVNFVRTIHNTKMWDGRFFLGKIVEKLHYKSEAIHVSEGVFNAHSKMLELYGVLLNHESHVIYNYVGSVPEVISPVTKIRKFLFIGRFEDQKGLDILLEAMKIIKRTDIRLDIVGTGNLKFNKDCDGRITFLGGINNAKEMIKFYDCLVVPSRYEGLGLVSVEGALAGVPVIISDIPGLNETQPINHPLKFSQIGCTNINLANTIDLALSYSLDDILNVVDNSRTFVKARYGLNSFIVGYSQVYR